MKNCYCDGRSVIPDMRIRGYLGFIRIEGGHQVLQSSIKDCSS